MGELAHFPCSHPALWGVVSWVLPSVAHTPPTAVRGPCSYQIFMAVQDVGSVRPAQTVRLLESWSLDSGGASLSLAGGRVAWPLSDSPCRIRQSASFALGTTLWGGQEDRGQWIPGVPGASPWGWRGLSVRTEGAVCGGQGALGRWCHHKLVGCDPPSLEEEEGQPGQQAGLVSCTWQERHDQKLRGWAGPLGWWAVLGHSLDCPDPRVGRGSRRACAARLQWAAAAWSCGSLSMPLGLCSGASSPEHPSSLLDLVDTFCPSKLSSGGCQLCGVATPPWVSLVLSLGGLLCRSQPVCRLWGQGCHVLYLRA